MEELNFVGCYLRYTPDLGHLVVTYFACLITLTVNNLIIVNIFKNINIISCVALFGCSTVGNPISKEKKKVFSTLALSEAEIIRSGKVLV